MTKAFQRTTLFAAVSFVATLAVFASGCGRRPTRTHGIFTITSGTSMGVKDRHGNRAEIHSGPAIVNFIPAGSLNRATLLLIEQQSTSIEIEVPGIAAQPGTEFLISGDSLHQPVNIRGMFQHALTNHTNREEEAACLTSGVCSHNETRFRTQMGIEVPYEVTITGYSQSCAGTQQVMRSYDTTTTSYVLEFSANRNPSTILGRFVGTSVPSSHVTVTRELTPCVLSH